MGDMAQEKPLFTRRAVAARLGVRYPCPRLFERLEESGQLPAVRVGKKVVRYRPQDVERLLTPKGGTH